MNKVNRLIQPVSKLICAISGFVLLGLGAADIQSDHIGKGSALTGSAVPLIGFVVGAKKNSKKSGQGGETNGD